MLIPENKRKEMPSDEAYLGFPLWGFRVVGFFFPFLIKIFFTGSVKIDRSIMLDFP